MRGYFQQSQEQGNGICYLNYYLTFQQWGSWLFGKPIWVHLSKKNNNKGNSFIAHWSANRLDEKVKLLSLKNGSELKETMKGGSSPSLPRDSLVPYLKPSKGALDPSLCLYKVTMWV